MFHCAKGSGVSKDVVEIERRRKLRFVIEFWRSYTKLEDFCYHNFPENVHHQKHVKLLKSLQKIYESLFKRV